MTESTNSTRVKEPTRSAVDGHASRWWRRRFGSRCARLQVRPSELTVGHILWPMTHVTHHAVNWPVTRMTR